MEDKICLSSLTFFFFFKFLVFFTGNLTYKPFAEKSHVQSLHKSFSNASGPSRKEAVVS